MVITGVLMDITKFPQYQLYILTLNLLKLKDSLIPDGYDERCVNSTIINRAYYSAYLYCVLWLDYVQNFKPIPIDEFGENEKKVSEHKQVRNALSNFGESIMSFELSKLAMLRRKADYFPFTDLTSKDISNAIDHMEKIFNHLVVE